MSTVEGKSACLRGMFAFAVYEQQHAINNQFENIRYFIDKDKFSEMQRFELKSGDLIMSCSGTMGKIAIAPENIKPGIINQALLKLTTTEKIDANYLKYIMLKYNSYVWWNTPDSVIFAIRGSPSLIMY